MSWDKWNAMRKAMGRALGLGGGDSKKGDSGGGKKSAPAKAPKEPKKESPKASKSEKQPSFKVNKSESKYMKSALKKHTKAEQKYADAYKGGASKNGAHDMYTSLVGKTEVDRAHANSAYSHGTSARAAAAKPGTVEASHAHSHAAGAHVSAAYAHEAAAREVAGKGDAGAHARLSKMHYAEAAKHEKLSAQHFKASGAKPLYTVDKHGNINHPSEGAKSTPHPDKHRNDVSRHEAGAPKADSKNPAAWLNTHHRENLAKEKAAYEGNASGGKKSITDKLTKVPENELAPRNPRPPPRGAMPGSRSMANHRAEGSSELAVRTSNTANRTGDAAKHAEAARYHKTAGEAHQRAGNTEKAFHHYGEQNKHEQAALPAERRDVNRNNVIYEHAAKGTRPTIGDMLKKK